MLSCGYLRGQENDQRRRTRERGLKQQGAIIQAISGRESERM